MKKIVYYILSIYRRIKCQFWSRVFRYQCISSDKNIRVSCFCQIGEDAKVSIKNHFHSNGLRITGRGNVQIGKYFHSGTNCKIMLGSHDYDNGEAIPYGNKYNIKEVIIGDFVWFGSDVTICGNIKIGTGAIIAMGAVVVKDVPDFAIVGGNPAKIIKYRDIDHFNNLLQERKFH